MPASMSSSQSVNVIGMKVREIDLLEPSASTTQKPIVSKPARAAEPLSNAVAWLPAIAPAQGPPRAGSGMGDPDPATCRRASPSGAGMRHDPDQHFPRPPA